MEGHLFRAHTTSQPVIIRTFLFFGLALFMSVTFLALPKIAHAASLRELQNQLSQAEAELARYQDLQKSEQQKAQNYSSDIQSRQEQIDSVKRTIQGLQGDINQKENSITATSKQIDDKTNELNQLTAKSNESLATYYELNNFSDVEIVANNDSLSHFTDQTEYVQALQDKILTDIDATSHLKQDLQGQKGKLEQQKNELAALKGEQEAKNSQLASQQRKTQTLLQQAKANQSKYQELVRKLDTERDQISGAIYELRRKLATQNKETLLSGTSGYPYSAINAPDAWLFLTRQCTSYAAWKWNVVYGRPFENTRPGEGSAWNWPALARDQGYRVVDKPQVSAIVSWDRSASMPYGHVAIVEGVNGDGSINVSEYNWEKYSYSVRNNVQYWQYGRARFIIP